MSFIRCICPGTFYGENITNDGYKSPFQVAKYNCPNTFSGSGCPADTKAWITATNANSCPGQQNRASNNFALVSGAPSGNYTITILADAVNINPAQISFNIYHNVGLGSDDNMGRFAQGFPVYLNSGNYNYYIGDVSGALGPVNICFS